MNSAELRRLRIAIDSTDAALVAVLVNRAGLSQKVAALNKKAGEKVVDEKRKKQLIATRTVLGKRKGLSPTFMRKLFKLIHDESVRIQKKI